MYAKKQFLILCIPCLLLLTLLFAGCMASNDIRYPEMPVVDISTMALCDAEDDTVQYRVPADKWMVGTNALNELVAVHTASYQAGQNVALNVTTSDMDGFSRLNEEFVTEVVSLLDSDMGMRAEIAELRQFNGDVVCYMETVTEYTDEVIDNLLTYGVLTEKSLASAGGRDYFKSLKTCAVMIYRIVDRKMITCAGSYTTEEQKADTLEAINVVMQTIKVK